MAIILPNTRNALGVPNRYSDLAAAGLRWTPPPVYRYDAYDVQGDTATLYEEDIDLADYQYNEDGLDLQLLPDGYKAISGASAGMAFYYYYNPISIAIDGLGMLRMEDHVTGFFEIIDSGTSWAKVSGLCSVKSVIAFAYAMKTDGTLWSVHISSGSPVIQRVGTATGWTEISGYSDSISNARAFGICDGGLYYLNGTTATRIGISNSWTAVTGFSISIIGYRTSLGFGIAAGNLYTIAPPYANAEPTAALLDSGGVWSDITGYSQVDFNSGSYHDDYIWSTVYGIRDGRLMGIVGGYSYSEYLPAYTVKVIDGIRTYHDVWLVAAGTTSTESTGIAISKAPVE